MKNFILTLALVAVAAIGAFAQSNLLSPYSLTSDTVTNTGTAYLTSGRVATGNASTVVQVNVTKISGTVAGTIKLQGSLDGTNFADVVTTGTQTAITAVTAADASRSYVIYIDRNPYTHYRVTWTGSGTMAASFKAKVLTK